MLARLSELVRRIRRSAFAFPAAAAVALLLIGVSELAYHQAASELRRLVLIGRARLEVTNLLRHVSAAESGQRGYVLTGRPEQLQPYLDARRSVDSTLERLGAIYTELGDPVAGQRLGRISIGIDDKLAALEQVVRLEPPASPQVVRELMLAEAGGDRMAVVRRLADEALATENRRLADGLDGVFDILLLNRSGVAALTVVGLLLLMMFLHQSRQLDRQRREQQQRMLAEHDRLEQEVRERTSELTELTRHLETAREDERARLARDLHDELGALLTAAKLDVARIRPKLNSAAPDLAPRIEHLIETLNSGIALKRRIIEDLRPSTLDALGLQPALEVLCGEFSQRLGIGVATHFEPVRLSRSAELTVFRMVQESLTNIAKHAQATAVSVRIESDAGDARVAVRDDGVGFDPTRPGNSRHGLLGMRYRLSAEQGRLAIESHPGAGTTLLAVLPQRSDPATPAPAAQPSDPDWPVGHGTASTVPA